MRYISTEQLRDLKNKLKVGNRKVNIVVEVDKLVYTPSMTTELDYVQFSVDQLTPEILGGSTLNITSAAYMISPIANTSPNEAINNIVSEFAVEAVNGKTRRHPLDGRSRDHNGIDLSYGQGAKVVAVADGVVTAVAKFNETNYFINVLHANGVMTRYLHVSPVYVSVGTQVTQGQDIALVGAKDSDSTGAHLHFEVRAGSDKNNQGEPRDPVDYLSRRKTIAPVSNVRITAHGVTITDSVRLRSGPSSGDKVITNIPKNTSLEVRGKVGEWFEVLYEGITGFVYENNLYIDAGQLGGGDREGGNPSYTAISDCIAQECSRVGLPIQLGLAIAWTESSWTQFTNDGEPYGSVTNDWGIMQINQTAHPEVFPQVKTDWRYNIKYGIEYAVSRFNKSVELREIDLARATYSAYNSGSNYTRYRTENDPRDIRFWEIFRTSPWISKLGVTARGGASEDSTGIILGSDAVGVIIKPITSVRETPEVLENNVIENVASGSSVEVLSTEGNWYKVRFKDGRMGYLNAKHCKIVTDSLTTEFKRDSVFLEDFEKYSIGTVPSVYVQDPDKLWRISNDGLSNVVAIAGGGVGTNYFQHIVDIKGTGKLDLEFKTDLCDGNLFCVFVNDRAVFAGTGKTAEGYDSISIPLLSGINTLKFARIKGADGNDGVYVDNLKITQYSYHGAVSKEGLAEIDTEVVQTDTLVINGDGVPVYRDKSTSSSVLFQADRGRVFPCVSYEYGGWAEILVDESPAYVQYNTSVKVMEGGLEVNRLRVRTGGFVLDRTFTLDNVKSVTIDRRYELRSATAALVLSNEGGYYSPDYDPNNFPEKGVKKSPFVENYKGDLLGVLSENTPIRISIGYGNHVQRRFTGLIDLVDIDGETETITVYCSDMMKKLNDYLTYNELEYPPDGNYKTAWLASSVIHDLAVKGGLAGWRKTDTDLHYPDIVVEETFYTDKNSMTGEVVKMDSYGNPYVVDISSLPVEEGYRNPYIFINKAIPRGTCLADEIDEICSNIGYWQRCDCFGTYRCTSVEGSTVPVMAYRDGESLVSLMKTINSTITVNHIIIAGMGRDEHFFDLDLWRAAKGVRKSAMVMIPWADTYGKKKQVAEKLFRDMKIRSRTMQAVIEGNPYMDLMDCVSIEHRKTTTKDNYVVKGLRESWADTQGYLMVLDLYWTASK